LSPNKAKQLTLKFNQSLKSLDQENSKAEETNIYETEDKLKEKYGEFIKLRGKLDEIDKRKIDLILHEKVLIDQK